MVIRGKVDSDVAKQGSVWSFGSGRAEQAAPWRGQAGPDLLLPLSEGFDARSAALTTGYSASSGSFLVMDKST